MAKDQFEVLQPMIPSTACFCLAAEVVPSWTNHGDLLETGLTGSSAPNIWCVPAFSFLHAPLSRRQNAPNSRLAPLGLNVAEFVQVDRSYAVD